MGLNRPITVWPETRNQAAGAVRWFIDQAETGVAQATRARQTVPHAMALRRWQTRARKELAALDALPWDAAIFRRCCEWWGGGGSEPLPPKASKPRLTFAWAYPQIGRSNLRLRYAPKASYPSEALRHLVLVLTTYRQVMTVWAIWAGQMQREDYLLPSPQPPDPKTEVTV